MYITFPDSSNAAFFERNPDVDNIVLLYKDRKPQYLYVPYDFLISPNPRGDVYDMLFNGNAYLLTYKHGPINFLVSTIAGHYEGVGIRPYHRDHLLTTIKRDKFAISSTIIYLY